MKKKGKKKPTSDPRSPLDEFKPEKKEYIRQLPIPGLIYPLAKEQQEEERCLQRKQQLPSITMTHHNHENQKWHPAEELNGKTSYDRYSRSFTQLRLDRADHTR